MTGLNLISNNYFGILTKMLEIKVELCDQCILYHLKISSFTHLSLHQAIIEINLKNNFITLNAYLFFVVLKMLVLEYYAIFNLNPHYCRRKPQNCILDSE